MTPRVSGHFFAINYLAWFSWYSSLFRELQDSGVVKKPWSHVRILIHVTVYETRAMPPSALCAII